MVLRAAFLFDNGVVHIALCILLSSVCFAQTAVERAAAELAKSHIDANVPDAKVFRQYMERDLQAYFQTKLVTKLPVRAEYQLLRDGPTQTGISLPKFYVWTKIRSGRMLVEGAARVAAIDKIRFEVTDFLAKGQIVAEPQKVNDIFPAALNQKILDLAGVK